MSIIKGFIIFFTDIEPKPLKQTNRVIIMVIYMTGNYHFTRSNWDELSPFFVFTSIVFTSINWYSLTSELILCSLDLLSNSLLNQYCFILILLLLRFLSLNPLMNSGWIWHKFYKLFSINCCKKKYFSNKSKFKF